jgi:hypothetical protein
MASVIIKTYDTHSEMMNDVINGKIKSENIIFGGLIDFLSEKHKKLYGNFIMKCLNGQLLSTSSVFIYMD